MMLRQCWSYIPELAGPGIGAASFAVGLGVLEDGEQTVKLGSTSQAERARE